MSGSDDPHERRAQKHVDEINSEFEAEPGENPVEADADEGEINVEGALFGNSAGVSRDQMAQQISHPGEDEAGMNLLNDVEENDIEESHLNQFGQADKIKRGDLGSKNAGGGTRSGPPQNRGFMEPIDTESGSGGGQQDKRPSPDQRKQRKKKRSESSTGGSDQESVVKRVTKLCRQFTDRLDDLSRRADEADREILKAKLDFLGDELGNDILEAVIRRINVIGPNEEAADKLRSIVD